MQLPRLPQLERDAAAVAPELKQKRRADGLFSTMRWVFLFLFSRSHEIDSNVHRASQLAAPRQAEAIADEDTRPINILCLDGGGIKGRNLMVMVREIEALTGRPIGSLFDLVGGTSIGGCGAMFLSKFGEQAPAKATSAMMQLQNRCLKHQSVGRLLQRGHLCRDKRRSLLRDLCGSGTTLASCEGPRAFAVASREGRDGLEPYVFRTYSLPARAAGAADAELPPLPGTSRAKLWQALLATSAAPVFFPRFRLRGDRFADGGLVANNPTLLALREARALWPTRAVGLVVSLGSGAAVVSNANGGRGGLPGSSALMWALRMIEDPDASNRLAQAMREVSPSAQYIRLQPPVHEVAPFEHDEAKLLQMEARTREHFRESTLARELCARLLESRPAPAAEMGQRLLNRAATQVDSGLYGLHGLTVTLLAALRSFAHEAPHEAPEVLALTA